MLVGDGEINEGSVWEAAMSAAKHNLANLVVLIDYNKFQSYGPTSEVLELEPLVDKWRAFGFETSEVDGHNTEEILKALNHKNPRPAAIVCHTVKGKGFPMAENQASWHHKSRLSDQDIDKLYASLR